MADVDEVMHQPLRLQIMAALVALHPEASISVTTLRDAFAVTDGNLGAHLRKLEDAGYIEVEKAFVQRKPRTFLRASELGRERFHTHVGMLRRIIGPQSG